MKTHLRPKEIIVRADCEDAPVKVFHGVQPGHWGNCLETHGLTLETETRLGGK